MKELSELQDLFETVIWYNGLEDQLREMVSLQPNDDTGYIMYDYYKYNMGRDKNERIYYQVQILWIMLVEKFGDYGTSPRFGWIEKIDEYKHFLKDILDNIEEDDEEV